MVMALYGYAVLGALVGLVVGAVEILQRYRDAPFRAVFNLWGVGYVLLNAAISYGTFWIVYHWAGTPFSRAPRRIQYPSIAGTLCDRRVRWRGADTCKIHQHSPSQRAGVRLSGRRS